MQLSLFARQVREERIRARTLVRCKGVVVADFRRKFQKLGDRLEESAQFDRMQQVRRADTIIAQLEHIDEGIVEKTEIFREVSRSKEAARFITMQLIVLNLTHALSVITGANFFSMFLVGTVSGAAGMLYGWVQKVERLREDWPEIKAFLAKARDELEVINFQIRDMENRLKRIQESSEVSHLKLSETISSK